MKQRVSFFVLTMFYCAFSAHASDYIDTQPEIFESSQGNISYSDILTPKAPEKNYWIDDAMENPDVLGTQNYYGDTIYIVNNFNYGAQGAINSHMNYGFCPFNTAIECQIWHRKPIFNQTVAPKNPHLRDDVMARIVETARYNLDVNSDNSNMKPLVDRYKMLMRASGACCTTGTTYKMRTHDASDGHIYKQLSDDANFYGFANRCLVMSNDELNAIGDTEISIGDMFDVRDGCLCRARIWFQDMLAPFIDLYDAVPEFAESPFMYTYSDGLGRIIEVSINSDVQNVLNQLQNCP